MRWYIGKAQHLGGRSNQEDSIGVFGTPAGRQVVVLADGAGGHQRGEMASAAAVKAIEKAFPSFTSTADDSWLRRAIEAANRAVMDLAKSADDGPRTTLVVACLDGGRLAWAHVGDSRLYRFRGTACLGRTRDDSVVQLLVDMNRVTAQEALHHPDRNRLLKALGAPDIGDGQPGAAEAAAGDGVMLCSDGVWEHVGEAEIGQALAARDLDRAAREMAALAVARSGRQADNASVILARLE